MSFPGGSVRSTRLIEGYSGIFHRFKGGFHGFFVILSGLLRGFLGGSVHAFRATEGSFRDSFSDSQGSSGILIPHFGELKEFSGILSTSSGFSGFFHGF